MTEQTPQPPKLKLSRQNRQQIRRHTAMTSNTKYGIGGLPRERKGLTITLRLPPEKR